MTVRVRMFVDDASGIGLWPDADLDDTELPLSDEVRARVLAWADEETRAINGEALDRVDHDLRGHALSVEVQADLGPAYDVVFQPQTPETRS